MEEPEEGVYRNYISRVRGISCGSVTVLHQFVSRQNGVLPHHIAKVYTGRRHGVGLTVGETETVTLLPFDTSWLGVGRLRTMDNVTTILFL